MPSKQRKDREAVALHEALADHDAAVCAFFHDLESSGEPPDAIQYGVLESWRELRRYFSTAAGVDRATWLGEVRKFQKWEEEHGPSAGRRERAN